MSAESKSKAAAIKADYGIDAPGVIRNLAIIGALGLIIGLICLNVSLDKWYARLRYAFLTIGIVFSLEAILMLVYAKFGKFRHRDRMLRMAALRGDERVLDIGTGRGLLAVGAARALTTGRVTAIDIWKTEDLSANARDRTEAVIALEGVGDRVEIQEADATKLPFADASFDVVVSNLCLHNIADVRGRKQAIAEIARVLKPGGRAVISDFKNTRQYADSFRQAGIEAIERRGPYLLDTFPPLRLIIARKNRG
jgi:SAM-dependent methyltransferase